MPTLRHLAAAIAAIFALSATAAAQRAPVLVRVRVVDTANAPVAGASITVSQGLGGSVSEGETDASGTRTFRVEPTSDSYEVTARKIGYARVSQFVTATRDSVSLSLIVHRAVQALGAVTITEREDPKRKSYHIDADEIASSTRPLFDGMDILTKLKPDIITGRMPGCGAQEVFVNGRRIVYPMPNDMVAARVGIAPNPAMRTQSGRPLKGPPLRNASLDVLTVMAEIKPEHIEELNYEDCFSTKVEGMHTSSALFVVLKPGISFEDGRGSYLTEERVPRKSGVAASAPPAADSVPTVEPYRTRLLGVFDAVTGEPLDSVSVIETASGTTARTTPTGTVSLLFLPEGPSTLRIAKPGYVDVKLDVSISPRDTVPITVVMVKPQ